MGTTTGVTCSNFALPVQQFTFTGGNSATNTNFVLDGTAITITLASSPLAAANLVVAASPITGVTSGEIWTATNVGGTSPTVTLTGTTAAAVSPVTVSMGAITGLTCDAVVLPVQKVVFIGSAVAGGTAIIVDGKSTTVATSDSPTAVATKVAATSYATGSTSGEVWTTSRTGAIVTLTGTTPNALSGVVVNMGTITGISSPAAAYVFTPGSNTATVVTSGSNSATVTNSGSLTTNLDDIWVGGKAPITLWVESSNVTYNVTTSNGTPLEQQQGTLTYGSALSLTTVNGLSNAITLTAPTNYIRVSVSNVLASSYVELHITR